MKTLSIFSRAFNLTDKWSLYVELELAPLLLLFGIGYEAPDESALVPCHKVALHVPTFRLEFRLSDRADLERAQEVIGNLESET